MYKTFSGMFLLGTTLIACTNYDQKTASFVSDVQRSTAKLCEFIPAAETVVGIATSFAPGSIPKPIVGLSFETTKTICEGIPPLTETSFDNTGGAVIGQANGVEIKGFFLDP